MENVIFQAKFNENFTFLPGYLPKMTHTSVIVPKNFVEAQSKLLDWPMYVVIGISVLLLVCCLAGCFYFVDCCYYRVFRKSIKGRFFKPCVLIFITPCIFVSIISAVAAATTTTTKTTRRA